MLEESVLRFNSIGRSGWPFVPCDDSSFPWRSYRNDSYQSPHLWMNDVNGRWGYIVTTLTSILVKSPSSNQSQVALIKRWSSLYTVKIVMGRDRAMPCSNVMPTDPATNIQASSQEPSHYTNRVEKCKTSFIIVS